MLAQNEIGIAYIHRHDLAAAAPVLQEVAVRAQTVENHYVALDAFASLCTIDGQQGRLVQAAQICQQALHMVAGWPTPSPPATGLIHVGLAEVLYEWNDVDGAMQAVTQGLRLLRGTIEKVPRARGHVIMARIHQIQGNPVDALSSLTQAEAWFAQMQIEASRVLVWLDAQKVRIWLQQGNLNAAARWADACVLAADVELRCPQQISMARVYLAHYRRPANRALLHTASALIADVCAAAERIQWLPCLIEGYLLQALTLSAQEDSGASAAMQRALMLARPGGYLRTFLDEGEAMRGLIEDQQHQLTDPLLQTYAARLLAAFAHESKVPDLADLPSAASSPIHAARDAAPVLSTLLAEPLSARELELLGLVADGLSNREIATTLIVTVGTVKKHLNNIFSKLGVGSRTQAIARELRLL